MLRKMRTALLMSGGLDSTSLAYLLRPDFAITIDYGQLPAKGEIKASAKICDILKLNHIILSIDCSSLGAGDLVAKPQNNFSPSSEWWPYRNQLLITLAAMKSIELNVNKIIIGSVKSDSFHIDGKISFINQMNEVLSMQEGQIELEAPGINYTSAELIKFSKIPLDLLSWSHSCHKDSYACGNCRGCNKHKLVMKELGYEIY